MTTTTVTGTTTTLTAPVAGCGCAMCQARRAALVGGTTSASASAVAATGETTLSGLNAIDSLLAGDAYRWNYNGTANADLGTAVTVTYSFMSSMPSDYSGQADETNFQALNSSQQAAVVQMLDYISSVINVTFVYKEDETGQIRYGMNSQSPASSAYAYYPNEGGDFGGDVWLSKDVSTNYDDTLGSYGYMVLLHETGHALGLKHPGNYSATGGGTDGPYLPTETDTTQYTVMSYNSPNQTAANWGQWSDFYYFAQSYQLYDIQALQYLYGANTTSNDGDTVYTFATSMDVETVYDGNGNNTLSAANQTYGATINLNAGSNSSIGYNSDILAPMKNNITIAYGTVINNAIGGAGNDTLIGNSDDDTFQGNGGNDTIKGTAGTASTAIFRGNLADYTLTTANSVTIVVDKTSGRDGTDRLTSIQYLQFADQTISTDSVPTVTTKPVVKAVPTTLKIGSRIALSRLYTVTAQAADTVTKIKVIDPAGGGSLDLSALTLGTDYTKSSTTYTIKIGKVGKVTYTGAGAENLSISALGLLGWGTAATVAITNTAPVVTTKAATGTIGASLAVSALFTVADAQSDKITQYKIVDPTGGGTLVLHGATNLSSASNTTLIAARDLSKLTYTIGTTEKLVISAYDGGTWSSAMPVTITTNTAPVVTTKAVTGKVGARITLSAKLSVTDAQSDTITQYKIVDPTGGGTIVLNRATNLSSVSGTTTVSASDLSKLTYTIGRTESLSVYAYDGATWSAAKLLTVTNKAPVVTAAIKTAAIGASVAVSSMLTVSDAESDTITQYSFTKASGTGTLSLGSATNLASSTDQAKGIITVRARDLSKITFTAGSAAGTGTFTVKANDGGGFGTAITAKVTTQASAGTTAKRLAAVLSSVASTSLATSTSSSLNSLLSRQTTTSLLAVA